MIGRATVHKVAWVHTHRSLFHQSILPILTVHGERLPHDDGGTHYAYDQTEHLADSAEIEHDYEDEDCQQPSRKQKEVLCLQPFELYRPTYTFIVRMLLR